MTTFDLARAKLLVARLAAESDQGDPILVLRTVLVATAMLLEEWGRDPVKELLATACGINGADGAEAPGVKRTPPELGAFVQELALDLATDERARASDPRAADPEGAGPRSDRR